MTTSRSRRARDAQIRNGSVATPSGRRSRRELPILGVWWTQVADEADGGIAAQQAVSVLLNRPQTATDAPLMREPGSGGLLPDEPLPAPVSFAYGSAELAADQTASAHPPTTFEVPSQLPPEAGVISAAFIKRRLAAAAGCNAHVDGDAEVTERKTRKKQASPSLIPLERGGQGGRKRRLKMFDETTATRELLGQLGTPRSIPGLRCKMLVWEREQGDGIVVGRMSGSEVQNGETGLGQLRSVMDLMAANGKDWRYVVLTLENSGFTDYEDRPDCQFVRENVEAGTARWVAWRSIDRMARHFHPAEQHLHFLERAGVDLYFHQLGRKVDWDKDAIQIRALIMAAYVEGKAIYQRTHGAIERRWLEEGRGYPAAKRYATQRDPLTKFLVEDKDQMNIVHWLHDRVASLGDDNVVRYGSLRKLSVQLKDELDVSVSHTTIGRILRDPIYLPTGEWWVRYRGKFYAGRPMRWTNPVPYAKYMETQRLLSIRAGSRSTNSEGEFVLNGILYHAACMHDRTERGAAYKLRAAARRDKTPRYHHSPKAAPQCPRYSISARTIEPVVMRELRRLLETPALERAWKEAARQQEHEPDAPPTEDQVARLEEEHRNLKRTLEEFESQAVEQAASGHFDVRRHDRLIKDIEGRIDGIQARIDLAHELNRQRELRDCVPGTSIEDLRGEAQALLTDGVPGDPHLAVARKALVHSLLSAVVLHDTDDGMKIELQGWLVPPGAGTSDLPAAHQVADAAMSTATRWATGAGTAGDTPVAAADDADEPATAFQPDQKRALAIQLEPANAPSSTPPARRVQSPTTPGFEPLPSAVTEREYSIDLPPMPEQERDRAAPYQRRHPLVRMAAVDGWKRHWGGRPAFRSPLIPLGRDLRRWHETPEGLAAARAAMRLATAQLRDWEPPVGYRRFTETMNDLSDRILEGSVPPPSDMPYLLSWRTSRLMTYSSVHVVCAAHGTTPKDLAAGAWSERHPDLPVPRRSGELGLPAARAALSAALARLPPTTNSLNRAKYESVRSAEPDLHLPCFRHVKNGLERHGFSVSAVAGEIVAAASPDGIVKEGSQWAWGSCKRALELVTAELHPSAPLTRIDYDEARPGHFPHSAAILRHARRRGLDFKRLAEEAHHEVMARSSSPRARLRVPT